MTYHPELDDDRGGGDDDGHRRAFTPWRPLEPGLQALLDHIEAEGLTVLTDEQLSELQEMFGVKEPPKDAGAGTLRFNLIGYDEEVRRLLLERGWMFYSCGHWHKESAEGGVLDSPMKRGNPCGGLHAPPEQIDGERPGGRGEAQARDYERRNDHPH